MIERYIYKENLSFRGKWFWEKFKKMGDDEIYWSEKNHWDRERKEQLSLVGKLTFASKLDKDIKEMTGDIIKNLNKSLPRNGKFEFWGKIGHLKYGGNIGYYGRIYRFEIYLLEDSKIRDWRDGRYNIMLLYRTKNTEELKRIPMNVGYSKKDLVRITNEFIMIVYKELQDMDLLIK